MTEKDLKRVSIFRRNEMTAESEHTQNHDSENEEETYDFLKDVDTDGIVRNHIFLKKLIDKISKVNKKEKYLENWRKDYIERVNRLIDWGFRDPTSFSDVISIMFKFEELYHKILWLISQTEVLKEQERNIINEAKTQEKYGKRPEIK